MHWATIPIFRRREYHRRHEICSCSSSGAFIVVEGYAMDNDIGFIPAYIHRWVPRNKWWRHLFLGRLSKFLFPGKIFDWTIGMEWDFMATLDSWNRSGRWNYLFPKTEKITRIASRSFRILSSSSHSWCLQEEETERWHYSNYSTHLWLWDRRIFLGWPPFSADVNMIAPMRDRFFVLVLALLAIGCSKSPEEQFNLGLM